MPIDTVGLALLVIWVGALQIMLDIGKELDWFESARSSALAVAAVVGFAFFLVWELTDEHPIVDLRLFARRNFGRARSPSRSPTACSSAIVLLPLWLQQYMGYTATWAGLVMAPVGLLAIMLSPDRGQEHRQGGPAQLATFAFFVFALVLWMRSRFNTQADSRPS